MLPLLNKIRLRTCRAFGACERGVAVVELAVMLPVLILVVSGITELGRAFMQATAVEKGVRAGALYAARAPSPLSAVNRQRAENLVRTGTIDGSGALLASGYGKPGASISIDTAGTFVVGAKTVPVIRVAAQVPFDPILPNMFAFTGFGEHVINVAHEQAYIGD